MECRLQPLIVLNSLYFIGYASDDRNAKLFDMSISLIRKFGGMTNLAGPGIKYREGSLYVGSFDSRIYEFEFLNGELVQVFEGTLLHANV
jgi:hypothetical protein